jgi:hypothetical protein
MHSKKRQDIRREPAVRGIPGRPRRLWVSLLTGMIAIIMAGSAVAASPAFAANQRQGSAGTGCSLIPYGLIGMTWSKYYVWPRIGCAINDEHDVPGRRGRIQDFTFGQIVWSPDQAPKMTVWTIKDKNRIHVRWNTNDQYSYDRYIIRWDRDGQNVGQKDISGSTEGWWDFQFNEPGWYSFIVEGCDNGTFGSKCRHDWTTPVGVRIEPRDIPPPPPPPTPLPQQTKPNILVSSTGAGASTVFHVTGSGFLPNTDVTIRGARIAQDAIPTYYWTTRSSGYKAITADLPIPCLPGVTIYFSANDGRKVPDSQDHTGRLWSNTVPASCPFTGSG